MALNIENINVLNDTQKSAACKKIESLILIMEREPTRIRVIADAPYTYKIVQIEFSKEIIEFKINDDGIIWG